MTRNMYYRSVCPILAYLIISGCSSLSLQKEAPLESGSPVLVQNSSEAIPHDELIYQLLVGEISGHLGELDEAASHYVNAARLSDDPQVADRATRIAIYAKDNKYALQAATRWVELEPNNIDPRQILGVLYLRDNSLDEAGEQFEKVIELSPEADSNSYMSIANTLANESEIDPALQVMQELVQNHDQEPQAHLALATLAFKSEDFELAAEAAGAAVDLQPDLISAMALRARSLMGMGLNETALIEMRKALGQDADNHELRLVYARMLVEDKQYDEAIREFTQLLKQRPGDTDLLYTLGLLQLQEGEYTQAKGAFARLAESGQRNDEAFYYLGRVAEEDSEYREAIDAYSRVSEGQYFLDAQSSVASSYAQLGELEQGRDHLRRLRNAIDDEESAVQLYLAEGQLLHDAGQFEQGMDLYSDGLIAHPGNEDLLYARALMAEEVGRIDLLEQDLRAILHEDPENASALNALGYTLADRNERVDEALSYIQRALKVRPDDPAVIDSMGWVMYRLGNYAEAEDYLRKALELIDDSEIIGHLSEAVWAQGNEGEAKSLVIQALEKDPESDYLQELLDRYTQ